MYACKHCDYTAPTLRAARKHSKEAGPVWNAARQTMTTHGLELIKTEESNR